MDDAQRWHDLEEYLAYAGDDDERRRLWQEIMELMQDPG